MEMCGIPIFSPSEAVILPMTSLRLFTYRYLKRKRSRKSMGIAFRISSGMKNIFTVEPSVKMKRQNSAEKNFRKLYRCGLKRSFNWFCRKSNDRVMTTSCRREWSSPAEPAFYRGSISWLPMNFICRCGWQNRKTLPV